MTKTKRFGWLRDRPDPRDYKYAAHPEYHEASSDLPVQVSLQPFLSPVQNQLMLSSCVANAVCGALEYLELMSLKEDVTIFESYFQPISRLFVYYNARAIDGDSAVRADQGTQIRSAVRAIRQNGICRETLWPYNIDQVFSYPDAIAYHEADLHKVLYAYRVNNQNLNDMKQCLANGYPFVFGVSLFDSFMSTQVESTGIIPMPTSLESFVGGHAMLCVGYDNSKAAFLIRNSWGKEWGQQGYAWMPYDYLNNEELCGDVWTLRRAQKEGVMS